MASSIFKFLEFHILLVILIHLLMATEPTCSVPIPTERTQNGSRVPLIRVDSRKTLPKYTTINQLSNGPQGSPIKSPMKASKDVYAMSLLIGTPPVKFSGIMDTGSDLIWTKCKPNGSCVFDSSKSKSFSKVKESCDMYGLDGCKQEYQEKMSVQVTLGQETFTIGNKKIPNVIFGLGTPIKPFGYNGIIGMGRGNLSLVSQLKERVFSYCLGSRFDPSKRSILLTGSKASSAIANTNIQTMPLLTQEHKSFYYLSLEGISVGETKLPVTKSDFAISNGNGGMIIDSGTTFTYLEKRIVDMISNEFMSQTNLEKFEGHKPYDDLEHCFKNPVSVLSRLVFHFEGGANWELPRENYIYERDGVACLAFIANRHDEKVSIFGNMQQQNMMVLYDLDKNSLSFTSANCNTL